MVNKRKIIYFLVTIVAALLFVNVILSLTEKKETKLDLTSNKAQIEEKFIFALSEYGIQESWIKKQKIKKGKYDSIIHKYNVHVPTDVTIPVILKNVNEIFMGNPVEIRSTEKKVHGQTELTIQSGGYYKLIADFNYDKDILRIYSMIGFLISEVEKENEIEIKQLFDLALPIGIVLPLENNSISIAEIIKKNKLDYFIELTDDTDNIDFELQEDLGLEILNKNITNIISSFNSPEFFFINEIESGLNASIASFIAEKFDKRGRKVLSLNNYFLLKGDDFNDLRSLFNFQVNKIKPGNTRIFRVSLEDFYSLHDELIKYLKKGNKIVTPSRIFNY